MTVRIINADVLDGLKSLADESVHCVVTSPPYWGLRDYGTGKWEGGDDDCSHQKVIDHAAAVSSSTLGGGKKSTGHIQEGFKQVCGRCGARRIDGQIGLEPTLQDHISKLVEVFREVRRVLRKDGTLWLNYGDAYNAYNGGAGPSSKLSKTQSEARPKLESGFGLRGKGFKPKDLMLMPERLAIALCDDGWYIRARIIWHKPNPMPESVTDRPTKSHEHIWLMSKAPRYYYDAEAIAERADSPPTKMPDGWYTGPGAHGSVHRNGREKGRKNDLVPHRTKNGFNDRWDAAEANGLAPLYRNARDVWTIATSAFPEAHFATFPPELAERCIKAGCPSGGTVLDPFGGSGTTGLVADRLQRNAILIELNPQYAAMAERRLSRDAGMFANVALEAAE